MKKSQGNAPNKKSIVISVLVLLIVAVGAIFGYVFMRDRDVTPEKVFDRAIENSLSTKSYTTIQQYGKDGSRYVSSVDVSSVPDARVYTESVSSPDSSRMYASQAFSTLNELYFREAPSRSSQTAGFVWYKSRSQNDDGKSSMGFLKQRDAYGYIFGQFLIGNHSDENKQKIIAKIEELRPYTFNSDEVSTEMIDGEEVYVYDLKADVDKVVELNRYMANLLKVNAPTWEYMISEKVIERKYYITKKQPRLVKITEVYGVWNTFEDAMNYGSVRVINYEDFDKTEVITKDRLKSEAE